jgi:hypothetical protein
LNNSKDDACEEPKLVYNIEKDTLVPKVGNETSDEDVWNASLMRTKVTRMQMMRMWVMTKMTHMMSKHELGTYWFSLAFAYQKNMLFVLITVLGMMYDF